MLSRDVSQFLSTMCFRHILMYTYCFSHILRETICVHHVLDVLDLCLLQASKHPVVADGTSRNFKLSCSSAHCITYSFYHDNCQDSNTFEQLDGPQSSASMPSAWNHSCHRLAQSHCREGLQSFQQIVHYSMPSDGELIDQDNERAPASINIFHHDKSTNGA